MDPQLRKLLEVAYEAWVDTGGAATILRSAFRHLTLSACSKSHLTARQGEASLRHTLINLMSGGQQAGVPDRAGLDFNALRGSDRVGVYVGACGSETHGQWLSDPLAITGGQDFVGATSCCGAAGTTVASRARSLLRAE